MDNEQEAREGASASATPKRSLVAGLSVPMRWALGACLGLALAFGITNLIAMFWHYGFLVTVIACLAYAVAVAVVAALATLLFALLKRLRWQTHLVIIAAILLCASAMSLLLYLAPLLLLALVTAYFAVMTITGRYKSLTKPKPAVRYGFLAVTATLTALLLILTLSPGPSLQPGDRPEVATLALPYPDRVHTSSRLPDDPSKPGNHTYKVYYYATPGQKIDPYPGQDTIPAPTIDASEFLTGWSALRRSQLGFGPEALPLNGQVWMPDGEGEFPLTVILHGNHDSADRSDGGYQYLCELLASRGIIAVSIDENFLNFSPLYDVLVFAGLKDEVSARAYVLLEHIRALSNWSWTPSHEFYQKIDFYYTSVIGHSRGGEAAALAASFADLDYYPDNGRVRFNYPFRINTVIALAPVHRMHDPAGLEVELKDVNYLVLHGGNDMDVSTFDGASMYRRADVSGWNFKARVWIQHANHGQFNSSWGRNDLPGLSNLISNRGLLMSMEEQQQAAKVFIMAFLELIHHHEYDYRALFVDFTGGAQWLPPARYVTDYADHRNFRMLNTFEAGYDLTESSSGLVTHSASGFDTWTQTELPGKWDTSNRVLLLRWGSEKYASKYRSGDPVFKSEFKDEYAVITGDTLLLSLCSGNQNTGDPPVTFQIRLTDIDGRTATMSIDDFGGVVNPIESRIYKPLFLGIAGHQEPVLQLVQIPTGNFKGLDGAIIRMEWLMTNENTGKDGAVLYVDDLRVERFPSDR